jgi:hypothetical protein
MLEITKYMESSLSDVTLLVSGYKIEGGFIVITLHDRWDGRTMLLSKEETKQLVEYLQKLLEEK